MDYLNPKINLQEISLTFQNAIKKGAIDTTDTAVIFFDLDRVEDRLSFLKSVFPPTVIHTVAIKTNPLTKILKSIANKKVGLEAATFTEVMLAKAAGCPSELIVFDSPAKTKSDLHEVLNKMDVRVNVDNLEELNRISTILEDSKRGKIGLRINPQIGKGDIDSMSVAGEYSKFGIPINANKNEILSSFKKFPWLDGLHVHSGSQGLGLKMLVAGVKVIHSLALEINHFLAKNNCENRVKYIDIGGGFPISYKPGEIQLQMNDYVEEIKRECPNIFKDFTVITEFGRYVHSLAGWVVSSVEYVKKQPGYVTAIIHVGADLFLREAYNPNNWYHRISLLDPAGDIKETEDDHSMDSNLENTVNIAGPLCFGGDFIRKNVLLNNIDEKDYIVIHDTGANALNLWSRHCSRRIPKVLGYKKKGSYSFTLLKKRETIQDLIDFWSP